MVSLETHWKQLLWHCYHHGRKTEKDDACIKELMGNYLFLERPQDLGMISIDSTYQFSEGLKKGFYDLEGYPIKGEALHDYAVSSWEDDNQIYLDSESREKYGLVEKPFVYTYPERILRQLTVSEDLLCKNYYIDQFNTMWKRLEEWKGSNRAVATLYNPGLDNSKDDIPCLNWLQATIRREKLELHCMFRSNDLYGAWPSNMYFLTFLGLWLSENFLENIRFNGIHYHSSSLHIYETDLSAVKNILGEGNERT